MSGAAGPRPDVKTGRPTQHQMAAKPPSEVLPSYRRQRKQEIRIINRAATRAVPVRLAIVTGVPVATSLIRGAILSKFLITYHGAGHPDPTEMEAARKEFMAWLDSVGPAVTDPGAPVGYAGQVFAGDPEKIADIIGYSIIEADSAEAVKALLATHPFVTRGGTLQVNQAMG